MDNALDAARVGERWVLRRRLRDGSATDVIGWLVATDSRSVVVETGPGEPVTVDRSAIIVARRAPAARGGPDPARTPAAELEWAALPGWVARSAPLGEWTLRAGGGFTHRANSALAVGDPGMPLPAAADRVTGFARDHRIDPRAQVILGSRVEAGLIGLGWRPVHVVTDVLAARLARFLGEGLPDPRVVIEDRLTDAWLTAYGRSRLDAPDPTVLRMIVDGQPPRAFASVTGASPDQLTGIARGHLSVAWLGISCVWTDPEQRGHGLATAMMRALGHWAARRGARNVYLQVARENSDAHEAYARLGFVTHHSYRYLAAPS